MAQTRHVHFTHRSFLGRRFGRWDGGGNGVCLLTRLRLQHGVSLFGNRSVVGLFPCASSLASSAFLAY